MRPGLSERPFGCGGSNAVAAAAEAYDSSTVGGTLYQGLLVYADGRFVADLEAGGGVVRALRMARSDAVGGAGWRDLTGKLVFPGPVVLSRSNAPRDSRGGPPATTVAVPEANLGPPAGQPPPVDACPFRCCGAWRRSWRCCRMPCSGAASRRSRSTTAS